MVHRPSDSRLLNNLISHEKDYSKSLSSLLSSSHASYTSLTAYAASSPPPASQVILAVAGTLLHADEAFRAYARAVDEWRAKLQELKDLEDEVGNVMRDREILVTRLLKASSKAASKHQPSSSSGSYDTTPMTPASTSTLSLSSTTSSNTKLQAAQAELQACEAHLAMKEQELERTRTSAVREGLRVRFRALAECGARWVEVGKEVEVVLGVSGEYPNRGETTSPRPSSDISHTTMSSIAPSQSASQVGVASPGPAQLVLGQNDLDMPVLPASPQLGLPLSIPLPSSPGPQPPRKHILPHRITEESLSASPSPEPKHQPESSQRAEKEEEEEEGAGSSAEEDEESKQHQVRIVENPKFAPSTTSFSKSSTSSSTVKGRPRAKSESVTSFSRQNPNSSSPLKSSLGLQLSSSVSHMGKVVIIMLQPTFNIIYDVKSLSYDFDRCTEYESGATLS
ncbi:hypothetical protein VKT23_012120 [Stygiomarasmius scandens]|uniref:Uncharacterized protein n=1 Tax=Marasmiellus scandens TaxID=2682957 RepID=A0ABR1JBZ8_9AGAR